MISTTTESDATKFCQHCKNSFPRTEEFFQPKSAGGWYSYCRPCVNAKSRAYFHQKQQDAGTTFVKAHGGHVLSLALHVIEKSGQKLPPVKRQLTCLECRNCVLMPDTDWKSKMPMIWCNKKPNEKGGFGERRIACLTGCVLADARPQKPREWRRYWVKYGPIGDCVRSATPALVAYLKANWTRLHYKTLEKHTGRDMDMLRGIALWHGVSGRAFNRRSFTGGASQNKRFLVAQRELIVALYLSDQWPRVLSHRAPPVRRLEILRQRESVVARVNAIRHPAGVVWNWKQIQARATKTRRLPLKR